MDDDWFDIEDVEVYEDDEMLQNMYRQFNRIWNVEDFEHDVHGVHDNDEADDFGSDQSSWLSEDSEDSWNQSDLLLLPTSGRNSPVNEAHIIYGKSINIIDLLHSRETGIKSHLSKTRLPSSLLAFTLHTHWAAVSPTTMLLDAVKLLGRGNFMSIISAYKNIYTLIVFKDCINGNSTFSHFCNATPWRDYLGK